MELNQDNPVNPVVLTTNRHELLVIISVYWWSEFRPGREQAVHFARSRKLSELSSVENLKPEISLTKGNEGNEGSSVVLTTNGHESTRIIGAHYCLLVVVELDLIHRFTQIGKIH